MTEPQPAPHYQQPPQQAPQQAPHYQQPSQPPPHYQQAPPQQQASQQQAPQDQQVPHYQRPAPQTPHYQQVSDEQRRIWDTKGKRGIGFGAVWFLAGLLITLITYSNASGPSGGVYVVAWGPMLYGGYRIISGYLMLKKSQQ
ncbi:hypothetical protein [Actinomadura montaniterrae]|uniref:Uncharacterized protein n=1 Tax=Actinomadura montaniterrae TaxID=1803903 RepID=A0A6L3VNA3_9ACTN|nr:hypothetical protein [Actinomadura montaniterrae]KAB2370522.1 hypothetical protein F9B16_35330 [Actinomadura montaniterrae]